MSNRFSRRCFLRRSSGLALGAVMAPGLRLFAGSPNERLALGYVGVANRAAANLGATANLKDLVEVAALCDVDANYLGAAHKRHPRARTYHDFRRMLEREKLDAVVVSTPDHCHAVATAAALRSGRHVYCEKPLARTVGECRVVRQLAKQHGLKTQLGTQIHAGSNYRRVVELVQTGAIGPVREVHVWVNASYGGKDAPAARPPVPPHLDWEQWLGPVPWHPYSPEYAPKTWRNWWDFGSGALGDFGCHFMDLPHWALHLRAPRTVEVVDGPPVHPDSTPPWLILRYEYPARQRDGRPLPPVTLFWYHGGRKPDLLTAEQKKYFRSGVYFVGERGNLLADYGRRQLLPEERFADFTPPPPFIPDSVGHHREWVEAIRHGGTTTCNFDYSGALAEAVLLGNVAYRLNQRIEWDSDRLKVTNCPDAGRYLHPVYRPGWAL